MIQAIRQWVFDHASDIDVVGRQRIGILFIIDVFVFILSLVVGFLALFVQKLPITAVDVWTSFGVAAIVAISLALLLLDKYNAAAHIVLFMGFVTIWVQVLHHTSNYTPQSTIVYVVLLLALPALLLSQKWSFIYGAASLIVAVVATANLARLHYFTRVSVAGYGIDLVAASIFVVFVTVLMRRAYEVALDRVTSLLVEQQEYSQALERSEELKRQFYRDTIYSVTNGKLCIYDECDVEPYIQSAEIEIDIDDPSTYREARSRISDFASSLGLRGTDLEMFSIATGEALTNAIKHACMAHAYAGQENGCVWAAVSDKGPGIESLILPRALLLAGFSTQPSLGIGYTLMLDATDRIILKTSEEGTTVVLIKQIEPKDDWNVLQRDGYEARMEQAEPGSI